MKERAQIILAAVVARGGSIPPYASHEYDAYVSDVAAVKSVIDKQSLPAKAAFVSVLVKAASSWGLKKFDQICNLPRPQMFVVKLLAGLGGLKYDSRTVSGYVHNRDLLVEMEKRIASGTMEPSRMPANIQYLIVGSFSKLCLQAKLLIVESAKLPLTRKSLGDAMPQPDDSAPQDESPDFEAFTPFFGDGESSAVQADPLPTDFAATPAIRSTDRAVQSDQEDASARSLKRTAEEIGVSYDPSFMASGELRAAMAKYHATKLLVIASSSP